jgi:hypothetical protein
MAEIQKNQKVMINCNVSIIERLDALKEFIAKNNLRGTANRSDVIRVALDKGVRHLEIEARNK